MDICIPIHLSMIDLAEDLTMTAFSLSRLHQGIILGIISVYSIFILYKWVFQLI